jgi:hypothetical protein
MSNRIVSDKSKEI